MTKLILRLRSEGELASAEVLIKAPGKAGRYGWTFNRFPAEVEIPVGSRVEVYGRRDRHSHGNVFFMRVVESVGTELVDMLLVAESAAPASPKGWLGVTRDELAEDVGFRASKRFLRGKPAEPRFEYRYQAGWRGWRHGDVLTVDERGVVWRTLSGSGPSAARCRWVEEIVAPDCDHWQVSTRVGNLSRAKLDEMIELIDGLTGSLEPFGPCEDCAHASAAAFRHQGAESVGVELAEDGELRARDPSPQARKLLAWLVSIEKQAPDPSRSWSVLDLQEFSDAFVTLNGRQIARTKGGICLTPGRYTLRILRRNRSEQRAIALYPGDGQVRTNCFGAD